MIRHAALGGIVLAMLAGTPVSAADNGFTAKDLMDWCTAASGTTEKTSCILYVDGFVEAVAIAGGETNKLDICLPPHFTVNEAIDVFVRQVRTDPALQRREPGIALWPALERSYPCIKPN